MDILCGFGVLPVEVVDPPAALGRTVGASRSSGLASSLHNS